MFLFLLMIYGLGRNRAKKRDNSGPKKGPKKGQKAAKEDPKSKKIYLIQK